MKFSIEKKRVLFTSLIAKYKQIVLWGFRNSTHSHQYIHLGYFEFFNKMGIPCIWVDDVAESNDLIVPGSLVMLPDIYLPSLKHKFRKDVSYIFHQGKTIERPDILDENRIFLYEYRDFHFKHLSEAESPEIHTPVVAFFPAQSTVLQPWGTDLLASEFLDAAAPIGHDVTFVGTAWGDKDGKINGNIKILEDIENRVSMKGLNFHRTQNVCSSRNIELGRA